MRPRPVIEGRTYIFTRRCSERRFFLRPDSMTNNTFWYCLGWTAQTKGIVLHVAMSPPRPRGRHRPARCLFSATSTACSPCRQRRPWSVGALWDANQASAVLLANEAAQADKLAYVLANPMGLVKLAADWPGATALHSILGGVPSRPRGPTTSSGRRTMAAPCPNRSALPSNRRPPWPTTSAKNTCASGMPLSPESSLKPTSAAEPRVPQS